MPVNYNKPISENPPGASGYDLALEQRDLSYWQDVQVPAQAFMRAIPTGYSYPPHTRPLTFVETKDQGTIGACSGFGSTSVAEGVWWVNTGGVKLLFSPWAQYILNQEADGITGDRGATGQGSMKAAKEVGYVPKDMCPPYPDTYADGWSITGEMRAAAAPHKIKTFVQLDHIDNAYEEAKKFLQAGLGFIWWLSLWTTRMDGPGEVVEEFLGPLRQDEHGGGHFTCVLDWTPEDAPTEGLVLLNSWTKEWGNEGAKVITPKAWNQAAEHKDTILVGVSDLAEPLDPRVVDWDEIDF